MKSKHALPILSISFSCLIPLLGAAEVRRPNIILITADDLGMQVGCYGDNQAKTPNIDKFASQGLLFERAYVTQSSCSPSRASILTGLYPMQHGHTYLANEGASLKPGLPLLPNLLKAAGYRTGILGKLHLKSAPREPIKFDMEWAINEPDETRDVRDMARRAEAFIKESGDQPFFLYMNYFDPHDDPRILYGKEIHQIKGLPENVLQPGDVEPMSFFGLDRTPAIDMAVAGYYNCIHRLDAGIGMLMEVIARTGAEENTLVIFLSDNGPSFMRGKTSCYNAGVHVPFLVRWPGVVEPGQRSEALISAVDIAPTLLQIADPAGAADARMSGISILPILKGTASSVRELLLVEFTAHAVAHYFPRRGVLDGQHLYVLNLMAGQKNPVVMPPWSLPPVGHPMHEPHARFIKPPLVEFFDIKQDPDCLVNLVSNPESAKSRDEMTKELQKLREQFRDPLLVPDGLQRETDFFHSKSRPGPSRE